MLLVCTYDIIKIQGKKRMNEKFIHILLILLQDNAFKTVSLVTFQIK